MHNPITQGTKPFQFYSSGAAPLAHPATWDKRYRLMPGFIRSRNDGDKHYIGADKLARLYGVRLSECVIGRPIGDTRNDLIELRPRYDGNYAIPTNNAALHW